MKSRIYCGKYTIKLFVYGFIYPVNSIMNSFLVLASALFLLRSLFLIVYSLDHVWIASFENSIFHSLTGVFILYSFVDSCMCSLIHLLFMIWICPFSIIDSLIYSLAHLFDPWRTYWLINLIYWLIGWFDHSCIKS